MIMHLTSPADPEFSFEDELLLKRSFASHSEAYLILDGDQGHLFFANSINKYETTIMESGERRDKEGKKRKNNTKPQICLSDRELHKENGMRGRRIEPNHGSSGACDMPRDGKGM